MAERVSWRMEAPLNEEAIEVADHMEPLIYCFTGNGSRDGSRFFLLLDPGS